uniref:Uncharacterized protein n=1 Tax=Anguilla anguilla TaxID=7936 RepID=A0A0E9QMU8_ANGAN
MSHCLNCAFFQLSF